MPAVIFYLGGKIAFSIKVRDRLLTELLLLLQIPLRRLYRAPSPAFCTPPTYTQTHAIRAPALTLTQTSAH